MREAVVVLKTVIATDEFIGLHTKGRYFDMCAVFKAFILDALCEVPDYCSFVVRFHGSTGFERKRFI